METRVLLAGVAAFVEDVVVAGGIYPGSVGSGPNDLTNVNGTLYFRANDGTNGYELWRINSSSGEAELVEDAVADGGIRPGNAGSFPKYLTNVNGALYFRANDGSNGIELWRINDSSGLAELVEDAVTGGGINPGSAHSFPIYLTNVNGTLYFRASDGSNGDELWRINSSSGLAELVEDAVTGGGINPGNANSDPIYLTNVNGTLYFRANDGTYGSELWRYPAGSSAPAVDLSVSASSGTEAGQTQITVTLTASAAVSGDQTVELGVTGTGINSSDYSLSGNSIAILDGQTTGSVTFTVSDDFLNEDDETVTLTISNPSAGIALGSTTSQYITITDNDNGGTSSVNPVTPGAYRIVLNAGTIEVRDSGNNLVATRNGTAAVVINGTNGNDVLTVDFSGGYSPVPITFNGGDQTSMPGDSLVLSGGTFSSVTHTFTNANDGSIALTGNLTISYTGLEPITDNLSATDRVFTFNGGAETVELTDAMGANTTIDSTLGESVTFPNPTGSLTINLNGGDTLHLNSVDAAFAAAVTLNGTTSNNSFQLTASEVLPNSTDLTVSGTAIFALNGFNETIDALAGNGSVDNTDAATAVTLTVGSNNGSATFSGVIQNTGLSLSLTKSGSGVQTVSGLNTYTGETTINGGSLKLGASNVLPNATVVTVNAGGTLDLNDMNETINRLILVDTGTVSDPTSTSNTLTLASTGTALSFVDGADILSTSVRIALSGAGGGSVVMSGTPASGRSSILNLTSLDLGSVSREFNVADVNSTGSDLVVNGVIGGSGGIIKTGPATLKLGGTNTYTGLTDIQAGTLFVQGSSANDPVNRIPDANTVQVSGGTFNVTSASETIGKLILVSGTVSRDMSGSLGTLTVNTASDGFDVRSGTITEIVLAGSAALTKTTSGTVTMTSSNVNSYSGGTNINGGILNVSADSILGPIPGAPATNITFGGGTLQLGASFDTSFNRNITLNAGGGTIDTNGFSTTIAGVISGSGSLTKSGSGVLSFSTENTYTGATTISVGTLRLLNADERISDSSAVTVASGATFDLNGFIEAVGSIAGAGSVTLGTGLLAAGGNDTSTTFSGVISGTGVNSLAKIGTGTLTLSGANTYSGITEIYDGTLKVGAAGTIPNASTVQMSGGTFDLNNISETIGALGGTSMTASVSLGSVTLTTGGNSASTNFNGVISGTGQVIKDGSGAFVLFGNNTYTGATTINAGSVELSGTAASGSFAIDGGTLKLLGSDRILDTSSVTVAGGATFDLAGNNETVDSIAGAGNVKILGAYTLTTGTSSTTFSGVISDSGGLTKSGPGTLTLSGPNTYTGATTINAGTLRVTGSTAAGSAVTVNNGGTLGGTGTVNGPVTTQSGGTVAPGTSPGILNTGDITFASGSNFNVELDGTAGAGAVGGHDQVNVTGSVTLNDGNLVVTTNYTPATGDSFVIINNNGSDAVMGLGTFKVGGVSIADGGAFITGGNRFLIDYSGGSNNNDVVLTVQNFTTEVTLDGSGNLVIADIASKADTLTIKSNAATGRFEITDPNNLIHTTIPGATGDLTNSVTVLFTSVTGPQIQITTLAGNDSLTVDHTLGTFSKTVVYSGGDPTTGPGDSLSIVVTAAQFNLVTFNYTNANDGSVSLDTDGPGPAVASTITYTGLEPIAESGTPTNLVFNLTGSADNAVIEDFGTTSDGQMRIRSTDASPTFETTVFASPSTSLTINGGAGADTITISSVDTTFVAALTIDGQGDVDTVNQNASLSLGSGALTGTLTITAETVNLNGSINTTPGTTDGAVTITADNLDMANAVNAGTATVTLVPHTAGRAIDLGTNTVGSLSLTDTELDQITAGKIVIGNATTGAVTFSAAIAMANSNVLEVITGSTINDTGATTVFTDTSLALSAVAGVGTTSPLNVSVSNLEADGGTGGVNVTNIGNLTIGGASGSLTGIAATNAAISITAANDITVSEAIDSNGGSVSLVASDDILVNANISSDGGNITLNSDSDATSGGGIKLNGGVSVASSGGSITIGGGADPATTSAIGTADSNSAGFYAGGATVSSGAGNISIRGQGQATVGAGRGVVIFGGTKVQSTTGSITMGGTGGMGTTTNQHEGVVIQGSNSGVSTTETQVTSTSGNISITGTAGTGSTGNENRGVAILRDALVKSTSSGNITVTGTGAGSGGGSTLNSGVALLDDGVIENTSGTLTINATAGVNTAGLDLDNSANNRIGGSSTSGAITINTDNFGVTNGTIRSSGALTIKPLTASATIGIGGGSGTLNISDAELTKLTDGFNSITIGDAAAGTGAADVDSSTFTDPVNIVGGSIAVTELSAGSNAVTLTARTGAITDGGDVGTDVTGSSLVATSVTGVGASGDELSTVVSNLEAVGGTGGVFVANTGNLTIGGIGSTVGVSASNAAISISAASTITVTENVSSGGGNVTLLATGDLTVSTGVTVNAGAGTSTLGADLTAASAGDNGTGTLTISSGASVTSSNTTTSAVTLRGADMGLVGTVSATGVGGGVAVRSSVSTRPMSIGDGDSAVSGVNLTDTELGKISTLASGMVTIGDTGQTGDITFTTATPATTAGAATVVLQSTSGSGKIVLDDASGAATALDGNGGTISLTAGTAGITAASANNSAAEIATTAATVTMNTTGPIGTSTNRIQFADNTNTAQQNVVIGSSNQASSVFLDGLGSLTLGNITGGTANTGVNVTARSNLVVAGSATINSGTSTLSLGADLTSASAGDEGTGTLTISSGASVTSSNTTTSAVTLRGADMGLVGTVSATGVGGGVITRSSVSTRPMSIGDGDSAVSGVNLTDTELGKISTLASGTVTIGDGSQTGDITFTTATAATTAGAATVVLQSTSGGGKIVLADGSTALDGNGGTISLTAGTGGITSASANNSAAEISTTGATVTLNTTGPIGTSTNRIQFADNTNTAQLNVIIGSNNQASSVFLDGLGSLTLGNISGGTANTSVDVTAHTNLVVAGNATIDSGANTVSLGADMTAASAGDDGSGTLTINASAAVYGANITLRGADEDIASTATVGVIVEASGSTFATASTNVYGLAFDSSGNLYASNEGNNTVSKFAANGTLLNATFIPASAGLSSPVGIAFDPSGNLYVANYGNGKISKFDSTGTLVNLAFATVTGGPVALMYSGGFLYVGDGSGVSKISTSNGNKTTFNPVAGGNVYGLAVDTSGNIYIDNLDATVKKYDSSGNLLNASFATGLVSARGLAIDSANNLYIADNFLGTTNKIKKIPPSGGTGSVVATVSDPNVLAFDGSGTLYVGNNHDGTITTLQFASGTSTNQVTIRSSLAPRPMSIGGTNSAVTGINLTDAELARLITASSGTVTFGDTSQTGNITFTTATPATTAGAATVALQSMSGAGQIILDNGAGTSTALNGNTGNVTLTAGTGGIIEAATNTTKVNDIGNATSTSLTSAGTVGTGSQPLQLGATSLTTNSSANNSNQFLKGTGAITIAAGGLSAGTGTVQLAGGTFTLGGSNRIDNSSDINVTGGSTLALGTNADTIDQLILTDGSVTGTGAGTLTGSSTFDVRKGSISAILGGTVGLTKTTVDTVTLSGANTFTGATTISGGTLFVTGSTASGSAVTVQNAATLGGTGTVAGTVSVQNGGTVAPGMSPGILNSGSVTFASGSIFKVEINGSTTAGTDYDQLVVTGSVSLGNATLTTTGSTISSSPGQQVKLIDNNGSGDAVVGTFNGLADGATVLVNSITFYISYVGGDGNDVTLTEASTSPPTIPGTAGSDVFEVRRIGNTIQVLNGGVVIDARPIASLTGLGYVINGTGGSDILTVNYADDGTTDGFFGIPITFNGGDPTVVTPPAVGDTMVINDAPGTAGTVTHDFTNGHDGSVNIDGTTLTYTGLEPIVDNMGAVNRVFTFNGGTETITVSDTGGADGMTTIDSDVGGESVTFANPTGSLTIHAGTGNDTVLLNGVDAAFDADVTVNGGDGTDSVTIGGAINVGTGDVLIGTSTDVESINVNGLLTTSGAVTLLASGNVLVAAIGGGIDNDAGTAAISITSSGGVVTASSLDSRGMVSLNANGNVTVTSTKTVGEVRINSATGAIIDGGDALVDITAATVQLVAATGIGDAGDLRGALESAADAMAMSLTLAAVTEAGDINVTNVGHLIVGTVNGTSGVTITDAANNNLGDAINLTAFNTAGASPLTVNQVVVNNDGGNITLNSSGPGIPATVHDYPLNASFADTLGGPSIVSAGGTLGATGYTFGAQQGPNLSNAINASEYSLEMFFRLDITSGTRKLIDFKNLTSDAGLYVANGAVQFFGPGAGPSGSVPPSPAIHHLVITRSAATNMFVAYLNGVQLFAFADNGSAATFSGPNNIIHFLRDDNNGTEEAPGFLDSVRIYNQVLTAANVTSLFNGAVATSADDVSLNANVTATGGNGTVTINSANDILQNLGTISVVGSGGVDANAGTGTANGLITMGASTTITGQTGPVTLDADGTITIAKVNTTTGSVTATSSAGGITVLDGPGGIAATGAATITLNATTSVTVNDPLSAVGGAVVINGAGNVNDPIQGAGTTFTKLGSGTLNLNATNTYTGATSVNGGTLLVFGSTTAASAVTVASGATLGGTGTVGGTVLVNGTIAPGASPGILNTGSVTFADNSTFAVEIGGNTPGNAITNHDQLNVTGTVSIGSNVSLNISSFNGYVPVKFDAYVLINNDVADAVTGTFVGKPENTAFTFDLLTSNLLAATTYKYSGGTGNDVAVIVGMQITGVTITPSTTINENDTVTVTGGFSPSSSHTNTVKIVWGDGTPNTTINLAAGVTTFQTTHTYLDDNPTATTSDMYALAVTVTDDVNPADTDSKAFVVTVNNVRPILDDGKVNFTNTPFTAINRTEAGTPFHTLGNWVVSGGGTTVTETRRSVPTVYLADASTSSQTLRGSVRVESTAGETVGDFLGFVMGFDANDFTDAGADYLLLDWKQMTQSVSNVPAQGGLALSRVTGFPANLLEVWGHTTSVTELARGATLGNTGWVKGQTYDVLVDYTPTRVIVIVDGVQQLDVLAPAGNPFSAGRLGFYAYSQNFVSFSNFVDDALVAHDNIPVSFTKTFTDPGTQDTFTTSIDWGDGSPLETGTLVYAMGVGSISGTHTYVPLGDKTVTVTIRDDDDATLVTDTFLINVQDPPPPPTNFRVSGLSTDSIRTAEWTASEGGGAVFYELKLDNLTTGESDVLLVSNITDTSFTLSTPLAAGDYRAMVRGYSDHGDAGGWSLPYDFTVSATPPAPITSPVTTRFYRAYNPNADFHFFTTSAGEFDNAVAHGYRDETTGRAGFNVDVTADTGASVIYRLYNIQKGYHYYTFNTAERDYLMNLVPAPAAGQPDTRTTGWRYEKNEGYIHTTPVTGATEIFRLYNTNTGVHLYTENAATKNAVLTAFPGTWVQHASFGYAFAVGAGVDPRSAAVQRDAGATSPVVPMHTWFGSEPLLARTLSGTFDASVGNQRTEVVVNAVSSPECTQTSRRIAPASVETSLRTASVRSVGAVSPDPTSWIAPHLLDQFWQEAAHNLDDLWRW